MFYNPTEVTIRNGLGTLDKSRHNIQNGSAMSYDDQGEEGRENSGISLKSSLVLVISAFLEAPLHTLYYNI